MKNKRAWTITHFDHGELSEGWEFIGPEGSAGRIYMWATNRNRLSDIMNTVLDRMLSAIVANENRLKSATTTATFNDTELFLIQQIAA